MARDGSAAAEGADEAVMHIGEQGGIERLGEQRAGRSQCKKSGNCNSQGRLLGRSNKGRPAVR